MAQYKITLAVLALCIVAIAQSAPTEDAASSTTPAPTTTTAATTTTTASSTTASMTVSPAPDNVHLPGNTSFTCFNRKVGYYADTEADCKVYHFCMLGDYNGQEVYQRVSYLCLNETIFDQQALDCVESAKMTAPCSESIKFYDDSNAILRKAIIGKPSLEEEVKKEGDEKKKEEASASTTPVAAVPAADSASPATTDAAPATTTTTTTTTVSPPAN